MSDPNRPAAPRIVSLVPSATETVFALGLGDHLVGRSHACDFPRQVLDRPILTRPHLTTDSSRGVHDEVRSRLSEGLAIYDLDLDGLRALAPTHLLVQDQCSVCAVSPADLEASLAAWLGAKPTLVRLAPHDLADVWRDIESIGLALDHGETARALRQTLSFRLSDLAEAIGTAVPETRPRVACIEWLDPVMIAGHWVPELVRLAGGEPVLGETGGPSRTVDIDTLIESAADVFVIQACGFDLEKSLLEWAAQPALAEAIMECCDRNGRPVPIAIADGDAYFNRPGPRLVDSAELLGEIVYPGAPLPPRPVGDASRHAAAVPSWQWLRPPVAG